MTNTKKLSLTKTPVVAVLAMICCALWGSAFPCIKIGYQLFHIENSIPASKILFAGCRFTLAGILVILFSSIQHKRFVVPKRTSLPYVAVLSLLQTVCQYFFFYLGLVHTSGVKSSIITGSNSFLAILAAAFLFRQEKMTGKKFLGCLLGFLGVILINLDGSGFSLSFSLTGEGFILFSALSSALSSCAIKRYSQKENPVALSGWQFLCGGLLLMVLGASFGGRLTFVRSQGILMLLYLAFLSAAAYTLWSILLSKNAVSKVSVFGFMNPVFGVFLSGLLLQESSNAFGIISLLALALVSIGIIIVNLAPKN